MYALAHGWAPRTPLIASALLVITAIAAADPIVEPYGQSPACKRIERARLDAHLPGMTAAIDRGNGFIVEFASGTSVGDGQPIRPGAKFLSGSIGKTFVAALAMDLHARAVLDLDAPLKTLLGSEPWFKALPNSCCVTLRQLLNHSSGWPEHVDMPTFRRAISERVQKCQSCLFTALEAIHFIEGAKPLSAPGQGYLYSETNYLVVGLAIEKASGRKYYDLLRERILAPLHLAETVPSDRNVIPGLVSGAIAPGTNYFGLKAAATMRDGQLLYNPGLEWTGGGLAASSADLVRWGRLLYVGRALPDPYLHELFTSVKADKPLVRYGLGVRIRGRGATVTYGHSGSIPGYRASLSYFPARQMTVAVQFNADPDNDGDILSGLTQAAIDAAEEIRGSSSDQFTGIQCH